MNKSLYVLTPFFIISIIVVFILAIKYKPSDSVNQTTQPQAAQPQTTVENYHYPHPYFSDKDSMCKPCQKTTSDLSDRCCCSKSSGRYPIDLPSPEEPPSPYVNSCFNVMKYNLQ